MTGRFLIIVSLALVVQDARAAATPQPAGGAGLDEVGEFFARYCYRCHGEERQRGDLRLDTFDAAGWAERDLLREIRAVLLEGEMPPDDGERQPTDDERARVEAQLRARLLALEGETAAGVYRRLNRSEYQNTINDTFGTSFDLAKRLPLDNPGEGFSNTGEKMFLSPLSMKQYAEVAFDIAEAVIPAHRPEVETVRLEASAKNFNKRWDVKQKKGGLVLGEPGYGLMYSKRPLGLPEGVYDFEIKATHYANRGRHGHDLQETAPAGDDELKRLVIYEDQDIFSHRKDFVLLRTNRPQKIFLRPENRVALSENTVPGRGRVERPEGGGERHTTVIDAIELTGPYGVVWPTEGVRRLFADFDGQGNIGDLDRAIATLATKLFRRELPPAELAAYRELAEREIERGENGNGAVQLVLKAMLCSPHFLYKHEGSGGELDGYSIASRLSYFLWSSCPDEELMDLARAGKLKDPSVRRQQFHRMLGGAKSHRFTDTFVSEWLELEKIKEVEPHEAFFRKQDFHRVKGYLHREPIEFFKVMLEENLSVTNFVDSDFAVINDVLNGIYHLGGKFPPGHGFAKVELGKGGPRPHPNALRRGGLLTQAGMLLMTSDGTVTSPIYRGVWVLKKLFGSEFVPPNNVSTLPADVRGATSIRELVKKHRADPSCARCHDKIDPVGIALENYDMIGRWREQYSRPVLVKKEGDREHFKLEKTLGVEVDAVYVDGRQIDGIGGLKEMLLADEDRLARAFLEKLFVYGMGRELTTRDEGEIEKIRQRASSTGYGLRDMIECLVTSEGFIRR